MRKATRAYLETLKKPAHEDAPDTPSDVALSLALMVRRCRALGLDVQAAVIESVVRTIKV